jgi:phosphoserine phosphatase
MPAAHELGRWRLACFDLDGTLVRGTSVSQHLADRFGQSEQMEELERRYVSGEISNSVVAEEQARNYRGIPLPQVVAKLSDIACIEGIDPTLAALRERGIESLLGTVTWSFAVPLFEAAGFSIALNATPQAREAASVALDTRDLTDVLDLIPWE